MLIGFACSRPYYFARCWRNSSTSGNARLSLPLQATVPELRRLRELEAENAKLKRMYADLALENAAIKDLLHRQL